jgi:hypothetical protein
MVLERISSGVWTKKTVKCCNEKLCGRTISLIDSFSWLLSFVSGKQAENLSVGKTKNYWTNNK